MAIWDTEDLDASVKLGKREATSSLLKRPRTPGGTTHRVKPRIPGATGHATWFCTAAGRGVEIKL